MAVTGAIYFAGAFAVLTGGRYWKRASSTGAVLALLAGGAAVLGLTPVQAGVGRLLTSISGIIPGLADLLVRIDGVSLDAANPGALLVNIPSARVGLISIAVTITAMVVGSLLFPDKKKKPEGSTAETEGAK
jgi:SSS family solute:Na+ symporter